MAVLPSMPASLAGYGAALLPVLSDSAACTSCGAAAPSVSFCAAAPGCCCGAVSAPAKAACFALLVAGSVLQRAVFIQRARGGTLLRPARLGMVVDMIFPAKCGEQARPAKKFLKAAPSCLITICRAHLVMRSIRGNSCRLMALSWRRSAISLDLGSELFSFYAAYCLPHSASALWA